jgi:hypothetical protein
MYAFIVLQITQHMLQNLFIKKPQKSSFRIADIPFEIETELSRIRNKTGPHYTVALSHIIC